MLTLYSCQHGNRQQLATVKEMQSTKAYNLSAIMDISLFAVGSGKISHGYYPLMPKQLLTALLGSGQWYLIG